MPAKWRVIDTGLRPAAQNIALNRALLEARQADEIPSTLRFLRFTPSALLGYHQSAEQELNLDYCRSHGVTVKRRITGGGAIYFDETQLGWELYLHKRDVGTSDMQAIARRNCNAAAAAVSALGVEAQFRPRNDIEVGGRKISGTGGAFDGDALLYQGTLLTDFDVEKMLRVLRIPAEKLSDKAIASARERVANLKELLGRAPDLAQVRHNITEAFESEFDVEFAEGDLSLTEHARYATALAEIDTGDWVNLVRRPAHELLLLEPVQKFAGGLLRARLAYDRPVLMDGIITNQQLSPGDQPGTGTLTVTGEDVSVMMDLEEKNESYENQPDFVIATRVLAQYAKYGIVPKPAPTTCRSCWSGFRGSKRPT